MYKNSLGNIYNTYISDAETKQLLTEQIEEYRLAIELDPGRRDAWESMIQSIQNRDHEILTSGEVDEIRTELDLANSQTALLNKRLALQRRELDEKDRLLQEDPIGEANKRAEQILQAATNTSKQMIDDAEAMRSRALAAVRAAYFNTMGFRQNLEERFGTLQSDLDQSVRMLRLIETEDESEDPEFIQEKW
jgi:hypothetical protein